jgi:hypothetical protein
LAIGRARLEQSGIRSPSVGWFDHIASLGGGNLARGSHLKLSKYTLLVGANATGKTQLLEGLAGLADPTLWGRWESWPDPSQPSVFAIGYYDPEPHRLECEVCADHVSIRLDGNPQAAVSFPFGMVRLDVAKLGGRRDGLDDLSASLSEPAETIAAIVTRSAGAIGPVRRNGNRDIEIDIQRRFGGPASFVPWSRLSWGEQMLVAIDAAISIAEVRSARQLAMLVIDAALGALSTDVYRPTLERLADPEFNFQVLLVETATRGTEPPAWTVARLVRSSEGVVVEQ